MFSPLWFCSLVFLLLLFSPTYLAAQTTYATITGAVHDPSGAAVTNASITATHLDTGVATKATSNKEGVYTLTQLREGTYLVTVHADGFREAIASDITLVARDVRRLDISLVLGALESKVDVAGGATLIEAETPRISDTRTADQLKTLPLNDRGIWSFLQVTPTLSPRGGSYSFAGSRTNQSQFAIDGTTMSDGVTDNAIGPLANYVESFKEVKLDLANNSAEYPTLGQVTVISKSGTNAFNGSAFDYYQSPIFRARDPFATQRRGGVQHNIGLSLGGPVKIPQLYDGRGKSFWFVSGETFTGSSATAALNPTVPIQAWRNGDFSALGIPIRNPFTGEIYSNGRIPASAINPVARAIQERFYPLPNTGDPNVLRANNYNETVPRDASKPYYATSRLDHNFGANDRVYARFTMHQSTNPVWEGNLPAFGERRQFRQNKALTLSHTRIMGPTLVNELRYGYAYNNNPFQGPLDGLEVVDHLGLQGLAPGLPDIGLQDQFPRSRSDRIEPGELDGPGIPEPREPDTRTDHVAPRHAHVQGWRRDPSHELRRVGRQQQSVRVRRFHQSILGGAGSHAKRSCVCRFPVRRADDRRPRVSTDNDRTPALDLRLLRTRRLEDVSQPDVEPGDSLRPASRVVRAERPDGDLRSRKWTDHRS